MSFSKVEEITRKLREDAEERRALKRVETWKGKDATASARRARVARAVRDFWYYDRMYFTPDMYSDGYAESGRFHRDIVGIMKRPGLHLLFGPRRNGKTVTGKKFFSWLQITGQLRVSGVFSEIIDKAGLVLEDIGELIRENERILHDFNPKFSEFNSESYRFRVQARDVATDWASCATFSEGRSAKGYSRNFARPQALLGDDIETSTTPLTAEANRRRIEILSECLQSLVEDGNFTIFANDFDERSALHQLRKEKERGILPDNWHVHVYPIWSKGKPLWPERYPANTEAELRAIVKPLSESDWQGNFMQNPIPPDGIIFSRSHFHMYKKSDYKKGVPEDARGVAWCDPNLAKKSKGDTTAMAVILFSPKEDKYIIPRVRCRSYSSSHELLADYLDICDGLQVYARGFDGNVGQESVWTQFIRDYCLINKVPFPPIEYRRYRVDDLAKSVQSAWDQDRFLFPEGFADTEGGKRFIQQLFSFQGKKAGRADDAPDALISGFTLLHERGFARRELHRESSRVVSIADTYSF